MFHFKLVLLIALCLQWCQCLTDDEYCFLCKSHTMCMYRGFGKACQNISSGGVTEQEKHEIVDAHNRIRSLVARGVDPRDMESSIPKAANMMKMVWDDELQATAQRWADQCEVGYDKCRKDRRWDVRQIIFVRDNPNFGVNWTYVINNWLQWVSLCKFNNVFNLNPKNRGFYFTQMFWHSTYAIGCGRRFFGSFRFYVCNYGPEGDTRNDKIYEVGYPCSKCPIGTDCENFLCVPRGN